MFNFMTLQTLNIAMIIIWAIFVIAAIIIEFETANLVSIWFAAGGIAGIVCAVLELPIWAQILIFAVVSAIFVLATRPFVKKISDNQTVLTNVDRYVGMVAIVTKDIMAGEKGEIKVEFQKWPAISKGENNFLVGDKVIITEIIGNKMIVDKIKEINLNY